MLARGKSRKGLDKGVTRIAKMETVRLTREIGTRASPALPRLRRGRPGGAEGANKEILGLMIYHVNIGRYRLKSGDTPRSVAENAYSDGNMYTVLTRNNPDISWEQGEVVLVPNKKGRETVVAEGESTKQLLQRMYKHDPMHVHLQKFLTWNGGFHAEELVGETVYVPER